jgi:hypothetical protein
MMLRDMILSVVLFDEMKSSKHTICDREEDGFVGRFEDPTSRKKRAFRKVEVECLY